MIYRRIITAGAQTDIVKAMQWYEDSEPGTGDYFWEAVARTLRLVQERPFMYPVDSCSDSPDIRKARLKDFPYFVLYRVKGDEVTALSVPHGHQQRGPQWRS
jgi:plasmid stabilization system protein ParE